MAAGLDQAIDPCDLTGDRHHWMPPLSPGPLAPSEDEEDLDSVTSSGHTEPDDLWWLPDGDSDSGLDHESVQPELCEGSSDAPCFGSDAESEEPGTSPIVSQLPALRLLPQVVEQDTPDADLDFYSHHDFIFEVINCTSLEQNFDSLVQSKAHYTSIQEHSANPTKLGQLQQKARDLKQTLLAGPLDPNCSHNVGGVGLLAKRSGSAYIILPRTSAFKEAFDRGRAIHIACDIGHHRYISHYIVYGWSGGASNKKMAARTNQLLDAISVEILAQPPSPILITGDFNAEPQHLSSH
jgi:hypothetical protein